MSFSSRNLDGKLEIVSMASYKVDTLRLKDLPSRYRCVFTLNGF